MNLDPESYARLTRLLEAPDLPCLTGRGHKVTYAGEANRRRTRLTMIHWMWAQYRHLERDPTPYIAPAKVASQQRRIVNLTESLFKRRA